MISEFSAGIVIGESLKLVFRHLLTIGGVALICCAPLIVAAERATRLHGERTQAILRDETPRVGDDDLLSTLEPLSIYVIYPLASGAIAFAVHRSLRGERVSFAAAIGAALKRILALVGLFICCLLFMGAAFVPALLFVALAASAIPGPLLVVGALLLFLLGLTLVMMVYVAIPACIIERKGVFAAMRRSRELTAGRRWSLFVVAAAVLFLSYLMMLATGFLMIGGLDAARSMGGKTEGSTTMILVISTIGGSLIVAWNAAAPAVAYCRLVGVKDSIQPAGLLEVFD